MSVRVVVDLSTSLFRKKTVMISVGSFLVCTQLRLDTLHYNKLKAKKSDTGEIVVLSLPLASEIEQSGVLTCTNTFFTLCTGR